MGRGAIKLVKWQRSYTSYVRLLGTAFYLALEGASAVATSLLLMPMTDTEHPPAAGTVLAVVTSRFSWKLTFFIRVSVRAMSLVHRILVRRMRDLP